MTRRKKAESYYHYLNFQRYGTATHKTKGKNPEHKESLPSKIDDIISEIKVAGMSLNAGANVVLIDIPQAKTGDFRLSSIIIFLLTCCVMNI